MTDAYMERRGAYVIAGTHVSLDFVVYAFLDGQSAEAIGQAFPLLSLEQVYGAIAYYLAHRDDVDRYLETRRQDFRVARQAARDADPMFYQKLADAKMADSANALNGSPLSGRRGSDQIIVSAVLRRAPAINFRIATAAGWPASLTQKPWRVPHARAAYS